MFEKLLIMMLPLLIMLRPLPGNIQILWHMMSCRLLIYTQQRRLSCRYTFQTHGCIKSPTSFTKLLVICHSRYWVFWTGAIGASFRSITRGQRTPAWAATLRRWRWAVAAKFNAFVVVIASSVWRLTAAAVLLLFLPFGPTILKPNLKENKQK